MHALRGYLTCIKSACAMAHKAFILLSGLLFFIPISVFSQGQVYWQTNGIVVCDSFYAGGINSKDCKVTIKIYDNVGRCIRTLIDGYQPKGAPQLFWKLKDDKSAVPCGIYFIRLTTKDENRLEKVVILK